MHVQNTMTTAKAARLLRVSKPQVHWLVQVGKLNAEKKDGHIWLDSAEVLAFAETYRPDRRRQQARAAKGDLPGEKVARVLLLLRNPLANVDDIAIGAKCSVEHVVRLARFRGMSVEQATKMLDAERAELAEKREQQAKEAAEKKEAYLLKRERLRHEQRTAAARATLEAASATASEREARERSERAARLNEDGPMLEIAKKLAGAPEALAKLTSR